MEVGTQNKLHQTCSECSLKGTAIEAPDWQSLTRLCTDFIRDFSKFKILQLFILQRDIHVQILVHVVEYHNGNSNNLTTNNWIWQVQRQEEWTEHSKLWEENAHDNIWKLEHIFKMLDKRPLLSHTFLGVSESPSPNRGSREKPEITHDVMVSGTCLRNVIFPSNLEHNRTHFLQCVCMKYLQVSLIITVRGIKSKSNKPYSWSKNLFYQVSIQQQESNGIISAQQLNYQWQK